MTKEALTLALEALEICEKDGYIPVRLTRESITAIKEALAQAEFDRVHDLLEKDAGIHVSQQAQPEQEPVAWIYKSEPSFDGNKWHDTFEVTTSKQVALWKDKTAKPLYTTPPQRKPLLASDIVTMYEENPRCDADMVEFARAIEAAHGIKE